MTYDTHYQRPGTGSIKNPAMLGYVYPTLCGQLLPAYQVWLPLYIFDKDYTATCTACSLLAFQMQAEDAP